MSCKFRNWRSALSCGVAAAGLLVSQTALAQEYERSETDQPPVVGASTTGLGDAIIVTANRRSESITRVPASIAALSQETIDQQGLRSIDDVVRFTPGVNIDRYASTGATVSIRGISSSTGAGTTGIYLDDTPMQIRSLGSQPRDAFPNTFDVERIEVLRGPQGTLFGAGAQGGVVRFITVQPSLDYLEAYGRAEVALTEGGAPSYEAGLAVGAPIVEDTLGFRVSGYYRQDGGYIDRARYLSGAVQEEDSNRLDTYAFRGALTLNIGDNIRIRPSVYYNQVYSHDLNQAWASLGPDRYNLSDASRQQYVSGNIRPETNKDRFWLPALEVNVDLGGVELTSITSKLIRNEDGVYDYASYDLATFPPNPAEAYDFYFALPGYDPHNFSGNNQNNFNQEIRLASTDPDAMFSWVVGGYYGRARQSSYQSVRNQHLLCTFAPVPADLPDCLFNGVIYDENLVSYDEQIAVFGEGTLTLFDRLKLTAGLRYAHQSFDFRGTLESDIFGPALNTGSQSESPLTPKFSIGYQWDRNNLTYVTVAKGYRIGGANRAIPMAQCGDALAALGFDSPPTSYDSDTTWSYEIGTKNSFWGGRARMSASAYLIEWSDTIRGFGSLGQSCPYELILNLGDATSTGFDFDLTVLPTDGLTLGLAVGYNHSEFDETIRLPGANEDLVTEGHTLGGSPWTVGLSVNYEFEAGSQPVYVRSDYLYRSRNNGLVSGRDPNRPSQYDPLETPDPAINDWRLRVGTEFRDLDISFFVNNVLNETPMMSFNRVNSLTPVWQFNAVRPRTFGLTAVYRH